MNCRRLLLYFISVAVRPLSCDYTLKCWTAYVEVWLTQLQGYEQAHLLNLINKDQILNNAV